jgi:ATP-dependent DNA helicase RecG
MNSHRSNPYNPKIASTFFRAGFIESWGRGIEKICESCSGYGIPLPKYTIKPYEVMVIFTGLDLSTTQTADKVVDKVADKISTAEREFFDQLISYFAEHQSIDTSTAKEISGKSLTSVKRYLRKLVLINILEANGANKNRTYQLGSSRANNLSAHGAYSWDGDSWEV